MPHIQLEYSGNLEAVVDMAGLCEAVRAEATKIEAFPMPGLRVRAIRVNHYAIADGDPKHGFIDISIRLREGRPSDVKAAAAQRIFNAAQAFITPYMANHSLALSLEMRDIDPDLSPKTSTIRAHLDRDKSEASS